MSEPRRVTVQNTTDIYRKAFEQICDPTDWKAPIDCIVPYELANLYVQAIEFMTAVKPDSCPPPDGNRAFLRLTCVGYRNGPAGG